VVQKYKKNQIMEETELKLNIIRSSFINTFISDILHKS